MLFGATIGDSIQITDSGRFLTKIVSQVISESFHSSFDLLFNSLFLFTQLWKLSVFLFISIFDFLLFNLLCKILLTIFNTNLNWLKNWYSTSLQLSLTKCYFTITTHNALYTPYANMANHSVVAWNELYESETSWASVFCFDKLPQKSLASFAI